MFFKVAFQIYNTSVFFNTDFAISTALTYNFHAIERICILEADS